MKFIIHNSALLRIGNADCPRPQPINSKTAYFGCMVRDLFWASSDSIRKKAIEKLRKFKNPQYAALMALEFVLSMIILAGLLIYIDPKTNSIEPPLNIIMFGAILILVLQIYRYTEIFRAAKTTKRKASIKTIGLEIIVCAIIIASAYIYRDPKINVIAYPFNLFLFLAVLCVPLYFYVKEKFLVN